MSGTAGTLVDLPTIADTLLGFEGRASLLPSPLPTNPLLDYFQKYSLFAFDFFKFLSPKPAVPEAKPPVHKPLTVIAKPVLEVKPVQAITEIHSASSSSSSSVSISGKPPQPMESTDGSSTSIIHNYKPSESFGSSIGFHTYGPPQVGRSGLLFASRASSTTNDDDDDTQTRFPGDELDIGSEK